MNKTKNLHVLLPESAHRKLMEAAERQGRPATEIAREALERWLAEERRREIHEEIARYARSRAGTSDDLDPDLERAAAARLRRLEEDD